MIKKILFINPSYKTTETSQAILRFHPPIGLLNLASFLEKKGYPCDIINTSFENINWEDIKNKKYFLIGFTIFIGEFMKITRELSKKIKEIDNDLPIVCGGVMASLFPEKILKEYHVDYVVRYEGEYTLFELAEYLNGRGSLESIKGLSYKINNEVVHNAPRSLEVDLDNFPIPKWSIFGKNINEKQIPYYFRIMTSKGCPFRCSFCYNRSVEDSLQDKSPVWRFRTAKHVIAEIEELHKLSSSRVFTFGDDNFLVLKDRAMEILQYMKKNNFYAEQCIAHLNNLTDEIIEAMSGVVQTVIYAIESASPKMLKLINKSINLNDIPKINKKLYDKGITTNHNFIIGLPTEDDEDLKANIQLMLKLKQINPFVRALCYVLLPLPCTPLTKFIEKEMKLYIPNTLEDYEDASFDSGVEQGFKFRPWLTKERYDFLHKYCTIFEDIFQINNMNLSEESKKYLDEDPKLREFFKDIDKVNHPKIFYRPYVLDRVLKNEKIDLLNDLKR